MGFPGGSVVKNLPAKQETLVWFLGQEDPLEKEMANRFSISAWESHEQRILAGYSPWGQKESETTEQLNNNRWKTIIKKGKEIMGKGYEK